MAKRKPVICHLTQGPTVAGAEALATRLARRFRSRHQFVFLSLGEAGPAVRGMAAEEFPLHVIDRQRGLDWQCLREMVRVLQHERVDLVHAHQSTSFLYGLMARLHYHRPPILLTEHQRHYPDQRSAERIAVHRMLIERRDRAVAAGQSVRRALILNEGLSPEQVDVIYDGFVSPSAAVNGSSQAVRQEIGVAPDEFLIVQIARFDPLQDHALSIRTLVQVVRHLPAARLSLVGEGPEMGMIRDLVRRQGLDSHVLFMGPRTDHVRLLTAADVVLLTSLREDVPPILIEALAAGRPIVATRSGGTGEIVEDRVCGLLACPGDYGGLAEKIVLLAGDRELRERLGRQAQERAETMFSESSTSSSYSEVYRAMLPRA